jgi:hypothetical protein
MIDGTSTYYLMADQVRYKDNAPWPLAADGQGSSLNRLATDAYGNLPESWQALSPSPGREPGSVVNPFPWHNADWPEDVNGDGAVVPLDALLVINALNERTDWTLPPPGEDDLPLEYLDVHPDNQLSPLDALTVINFLNRPTTRTPLPAIPAGISALTAAAVDPVFSQFDLSAPGRRRST